MKLSRKPSSTQGQVTVNTLAIGTLYSGYKVTAVKNNSSVRNIQNNYLDCYFYHVIPFSIMNCENCKSNIINAK